MEYSIEIVAKTIGEEIGMKNFLDEEFMLAF